LNRINRKNQIPEGTYDYLPIECDYNFRMKQRITEEFNAWGYSRIDTPIIEYFDVFESEQNPVSNDSTFKTSDAKGRLVVLRPDITRPVARLTATKMCDAAFPLKLFYTGKVYSFFTSAAQPCERMQAGIELIGDHSPEADAEVIALAISCLLKSGITEFQLEIGQIDYFKGLMEEVGLSSESIEMVRAMIEQKNMLGAELLLTELTVPEKLRNNISKLSFLFGDISILREALSLTAQPKCIAAVENLNTIYSILKDYGLEQYVSFDLGMVQSLDYYTGMIFRGIAAKMGTPILTGGRYDTLLSEFGFSEPATGFAIDLHKIKQAAELQGFSMEEPLKDILLGYDEVSRSKAFSHANILRAEGKSVVVCKGTDQEFLRSEAERRKIKNSMAMINNTLYCY